MQLLSLRLKTSVSVSNRRSAGREFHTDGPMDRRHRKHVLYSLWYISSG